MPASSSRRVPHIEFSMHQSLEPQLPATVQPGTYPCEHAARAGNLCRHNTRRGNDGSRRDDRAVQASPRRPGPGGREDVLVAWGVLAGTSGGEWLGVPPTGGTFAVQFANVSTFRDGRMAGESIYFDVATLCEQAGLPLGDVRAAA